MTQRNIFRHPEIRHPMGLRHTVGLIHMIYFRIHMRHEWFIRVTCRICMCDKAHICLIEFCLIVGKDARDSHANIHHDSFKCMTRLTCKCSSSTRAEHFVSVCVVLLVFVWVEWLDSFKRTRHAWQTQLTQKCDMTHSNLRHDSSQYVTVLFQIWKKQTCNFTPSNTTKTNIWHESFKCVTQHTCKCSGSWLAERFFWFLISCMDSLFILMTPAPARSRGRAESSSSSRNMEDPVCACMCIYIHVHNANVCM